MMYMKYINNVWKYKDMVKNKYKNNINLKIYYTIEI